MDWDKLRTFHIVAEAGSFTHAGEALGLSQSAISRQISGLEDSLDVKLFHRHARGLVLTEAGELLANTAKDIFGKLAMTQAKLQDARANPSGNLRITAPNFLGSTWLMPQLAALHQKYPELQLSLLLDDRILNLSMREADAAIRLYKPDQDDLIYSKIGTIHFKIYASKKYFDLHGKPQNIKDLKNHTILAYPDNMPTPFDQANWLLQKADIDTENNPRILRVNSLHGIYEAMRNDAGLAVLPNYLVANEKTIDSCLPSVTRPNVSVYFVHAEERKHSKRINILKEFLSQSMKNSGF